MADLNVQPRRKSRFWLWVLLIIVIAGLLFFYLNKDNQETSDKIIDTTYTDPN